MTLLASWILPWPASTQVGQALGKPGILVVILRPHKQLVPSVSIQAFTHQARRSHDVLGFLDFALAKQRVSQALGNVLVVVLRPHQPAHRPGLLEQHLGDLHTHHDNGMSSLGLNRRDSVLADHGRGHRQSSGLTSKPAHRPGLLEQRLCDLSDLHTLTHTHTHHNNGTGTLGLNWRGPVLMDQMTAEVMRSSSFSLTSRIMEQAQRLRDLGDDMASTAG
jgi:hypothetical protein